MNGKLSPSYLLLFLAPLIFGCGGSAKVENKGNASAASVSLHDGNDKYVEVDRRESVVAWKGSNPFGPYKGYIYISKGEFKIENGDVVGGTFEVDMNTIEHEDHMRKSGLIDHLKDPDFFDVKKFPFSTIDITKVTSISGEDKEITGNLTIKGITHPVTFPAKIEVKDGIIRANGKLVIDRTKWGVHYNSGKFYDNLADKTISDDIEFNMKMVAYGPKDSVKYETKKL